MRKIVLDACASADNVLGIIYALKNMDVKALMLKDDKRYHDVFIQNMAIVNNKVPVTAKVAWGSCKPLVEPYMQVPNYMHVALAGTPNQALRFEDSLAWDVLYCTAKSEGKITLVTLSSLTNIAIALFKYEDLKDYIEEIVIMGGSTDEGNVAAFSEANLASDAYAAAAVVNSGIPLRFIGLNVARKSMIGKSEIELYGFQKEIVDQLASDNILYPYKDSVVCHDILTLAAVNHPEYFTWDKYAVSVECRSDLTFGRLNVDIRRHCTDEKNAVLAMDLDLNNYISELKTFFAGL